MLTDLHLARRSLQRTPAFTLAAVTTLALGIGANSAIFSLVYGVLLKPLPFAEPGRLVSIVEMRRDVNLPTTSATAVFDAWRTTARTLERVAAYRDRRLTVTSHGDPEHVTAAVVSEEFFDTLGARPVTGRALGTSDAGQPVVVLAWAFKQRRFGTGEAVDRTLLLDGETHTVVGVMPPAFRYPDGETMLWMPRPVAASEKRAYYHVIGRLRRGATLEQARAESVAVGRAAAPAASAERRFVTEVRYLEDEVVGDVRAGLLVLFAVVGVVLLVACINAGSLCLARTASRRSEASIRSALGASRWRLVRHPLAESVLVAAAGAGAGVLLAASMLPVIVRLIAPTTPRLAEVTIGLPVLAFTIAATALTVLVAGLLPAWYASRLLPSEVLALNASAGRQTARTGRLRFVLVTVETALSTVVLIAALLFARSLDRLLGVEADRPIDRVLTLGLTLPSPAYAGIYRADPADNARATALAGDVLDRVKRIPGVQSAGLTTSLPPNVAEMSFTQLRRNPATGKAEPYNFNLVIVHGNYFGAIGAACLRGRLFDERDRAGVQRVVIVARDFARRWFGREDVVGEHVPMPGGQAAVIGVVDDVRYQGLDRPAGGGLYLPYSQAVNPTFYVVVRTAGSPRALAHQVREAVRAADPRVPLGQPRTLTELRHASVADPASRAVLLGLLAVLALVLAAVGLYGNSSYVTSQRTFEVGLRMALGADGRSVLRLLVGGGLVPVALGLVIGLAGAAALSRTVTSLLFEVQPIDAITFAGVPLLLFAVAATAVTVPAMRATRVDPALTLRQ